MKNYSNSIEAIRDYLDWLESRGEFNATDLERKQVAAGVPSRDVISAEMLRLFRRGRVKSFAAERAERFCQVVGLKVLIFSEEIPPSFGRDRK